MSYLVLARKYRPRRFSDLVGQEQVAKALRNAITLDQVHHAYLFTGSRGVGKTSAARILAMALACEARKDHEPCGACAPCKEIAAGQSVDVVEIDGASNNSVEDARALREAVRYAPARAARKIYIIDEVHMLSQSAFNALLKTLEEPPAHVVFILATTEVHKIPATILSRVQRYDFKLIPSGILCEHLARVLESEHITFEEGALRMVARQANGSVRDALSLLDQLLAFIGQETLTATHVATVLGVGDRRLLGELGGAVVARDPGAALRVLAGALDRGVDLTQLARGFLSYLHDVEICGSVKDAHDVLDLTADELDEARAVYERAPRGLFPVLFDRWARALDEANRVPAPRLVYEMALLDLCVAEPLLPLGDLLNRLENLEARLALPGAGGASGGATPGALRTGGSGSGQRPTSASGLWAAAKTAEMASDWGSGLERGHVSGSPSVSASIADVGGHAAAPAPRPVVPPDASPETIWRSIITAVMAESPLLAAALEHAGVESVDGSTLILNVSERLLFSQLDAGRERIEALAAQATGVSRRLILRQGRSTAPAAMPSRVAREAEIAAEERRRREAEAREHPMIRKAQSLFQAGVANIKTMDQKVAE